MKVNLVALIYSCFTMLGLVYSLLVNLMGTTLINTINLFTISALGVIVLYYGIDRRMKEVEEEIEEAGK